jgi:nucleoside-diphosphate-sugar epimerase
MKETAVAASANEGAANRTPADNQTVRNPTSALFRSRAAEALPTKYRRARRGAVPFVFGAFVRYISFSTALFLPSIGSAAMTKVAILGATGPTGIQLTAELRKIGVAVRVVARSVDKLAQLFSNMKIEKLPADILDAGETLRAVTGCELVYDCIGLPGDQMHLHPVIARNIASALKQIKARCVQVSSYWSYYPQIRARMDESHPRSGGPPWVRWRREAEDILYDAGAAILHLPDFYGPQVHVSTLQNALMEAAQAKTVNWLGKAVVTREYIYVPDAMRIAAAIGERTAVAGNHWCLPGSGPFTGRQFAEICTRALGRAVKLRSAGMMTLRIVSLFNKELRGLLQVAPEYMKPISYDAGKLESLLGRPAMTPYETGIATTLQWIAARAER